MKKRILLLTSVLLLGYVSLSSYTLGPATEASLDLTGDTGGSTNCNTGGGCHANNSTATTDTIYVLDKTTGLAVTQYTPGTVYTVNLSGTNTSTYLTHFGFQLAAVLGSGSQGGSFATTTSKVHIKTLSGRQIVEHNGVIAGTGNKYLATMNWTAPPKGSGDVTFYGILNAVNNNGTNDGGDIPNPAAPLTITENTSAAVATVTDNTNIKAYPNPVSTALTIELSNNTASAYTVNVYDLSGKKIMNSVGDLINANNKLSINTANWNAGIYLVQIVIDGTQHTLQIAKQ
ncbi:MAG: T9SS type A sorting domain-containing protein [Bacteroidetes bacterium]|nr:T9SS type A sorting domain-containing protein [Bacteroidota bacterium]